MVAAGGAGVSPEQPPDLSFKDAALEGLLGALDALGESAKFRLGPTLWDDARDEMPWHAPGL